MRNLINFALMFHVMLTETDVEQLGPDVTLEDFKTYFEIPEQSDGFKVSKNFNVEDLSAYMTEQEKTLLLTEVNAEQVSESVVNENSANKTTQTKEEIAASKKAEKEAEKAKKIAEKEAEKAKKAAEKDKPKGLGVIASILEIIKQAEEPISQEQIANELAKRFPHKMLPSMKKTIKAQIGSKNQPTRMEQEKKVKFVITESVPKKEGEKSVKLYSLK